MIRSTTLHQLKNAVDLFIARSSIGSSGPHSDERPSGTADATCRNR
jgi:hypothetical protein